MRIAIVDDDAAMREELKAHLQRFSDEHAISFDSVAFHCGDALLSGYRSVYDIIFFDIDMPGTNGLDTARQIRAVDSAVTMVFVTNMAQYAINGYEVEAVDYIIKPLSYYEFSLKIQKALRSVRQKGKHTVVLETTSGVVKVNVSAIAYVEILGHYLLFHTQDGTHKCRGSMEQTVSELSYYGFCRIHKSYLINLRHINKMLPSTVVLGNTVLPVGRAYKNDLLQAYMKYLGG